MMATSTNNSDFEISNEKDKHRCKSHVWEHFGYKITRNKMGVMTKSTTNVVCKLCLQEFKYIATTTNMSAHLTRHHGISPKRKPLCRPMDTSSNSSSGPSSSTSGSSSMGQLRMTECGFKIHQDSS